MRAIHDHLSQKAKERYANETEEQRDRRLGNWIKAGQNPRIHKFVDTSIEVFVAEHLDRLGVRYEKQKRISYYFVDFFLPEQGIVVEANGCYWHSCLECGFDTEWHQKKRQSDEKRTERIQKKGYIIIVLWEHDIRKAMDGTCPLQLNL